MISTCWGSHLGGKSGQKKIYYKTCEAQWQSKDCKSMLNHSPEHEVPRVLSGSPVPSREPRLECVLSSQLPSGVMIYLPLADPRKYNYKDHGVISTFYVSIVCQGHEPSSHRMTSTNLQSNSWYQMRKMSLQEFNHIPRVVLSCRLNIEIWCL